MTMHVAIEKETFSQGNRMVIISQYPDNRNRYGWVGAGIRFFDDGKEIIDWHLLCDLPVDATAYKDAFLSTGQIEHVKNRGMCKVAPIWWALYPRQGKFPNPITHSEWLKETDKNPFFDQY